MKVSRRKSLLVFVCILVILVVSYFLLSIQKKSLVYDEQYVREKIDEFLKENPDANENYARDVVYHEIAIKEKNSLVCEKIVTEWLRGDCYNYFRVAR